MDSLAINIGALKTALNKMVSDIDNLKKGAAF